MFTVQEILKAAKGRLVRGPARACLRKVSTDTRTIKRGDIFVALKGNNFDGNDFIDQAIRKGAGCIIGNRSLALGSRLEAQGKIPFIAVRDTMRALGDLARFHRLKFDIPVIAVTGSNGKTTTKEMISWVLGKKFKMLKNEGTKNNNIGLPMALLGLDKSHQLAVLEIGTNHFGEVGQLADICRPNIGVITNIGPSHLEHLRNLSGVLREKTALLKKLLPPRLAILNADDRLLWREIKKRGGGFTFSFGIKTKGDFSASDISRKGERVVFRVCARHEYALNTGGAHNIHNALAAIAVGIAFGMPHQEIAARLEAFNLPGGRFNIIELERVTFIDDTYNSNPLSLGQALDSLAGLSCKGKKILVMGDMLELGSREKAFHARAGRLAARVCDKLLTVGSRAESSAEAARLQGLSIKDIFSCESSLEARDILFKMISPGEGDVVLVKGSRSMKMEEVLKHVI